jgi:hypothetical protein
LDQPKFFSLKGAACGAFLLSGGRMGLEWRMAINPEKPQDPAHPKAPVQVPKEPVGDAFPPDDDVSIPPVGSDEANHEDKKK